MFKDLWQFAGQFIRGGWGDWLRTATLLTIGTVVASGLLSNPKVQEKTLGFLFGLVGWAKGNWEEKTRGYDQRGRLWVTLVNPKTGDRKDVRLK